MAAQKGMLKNSLVIFAIPQNIFNMQQTFQIYWIHGFKTFSVKFAKQCANILKDNLIKE